MIYHLIKFKLVGLWSCISSTVTPVGSNITFICRSSTSY